jgi:hypothetical protein
MKRKVIVKRPYRLYVMYSNGRVNFRSASYPQTFKTKAAGLRFLDKQSKFEAIKYAVLTRGQAVKLGGYRRA